MESKEGKSEQDLTIAEVLGPMASIFNFDLDEEGVIDLYESALANVDVDLLHVAVAELMQELDWMPRPAAIIRKAKAIEAESSDKPAEPEHWKRDSYKCLRCRDTGWISVWSKHAKDWALWKARGENGAEPKRRLYEEVAKCSCAIGQRKPGKAASFNENVDVQVRGVRYEDRLHYLLEWAKDWQPGNYVKAFADF